MCGFYGTNQITSFRIDNNLKEEVDRLMALRGPDDCQIFQKHNIFLKHFRLITRGSGKRGKQPMIGERYILLFNGNIINSSALARKYFITDSESDTEVLANLIEKIGPKIISELNGFFAIVVFDTLYNEWILARDRLGIKPLFFSNELDSLSFASRADVLAKLLQKNINKEKLLSTLKYGSVFMNETIYDNIEQVPPGEIIRWDSNQLFKKKSYWSVDELLSKNKEKNDQDEINYLIKNSVESNLITKRDCGILFSGGVDSLAVTLSYKNVIKNNQRLYGFNITNFESDDIMKLGNELFLNNYFTNPPLQDINYGNDVFDLPFDDTSSNLCLQIYEKASKKVAVCLTGDGADEIFGGYSCFRNSSKLNLDNKILKNLKEFILNEKIIDKTSIKNRRFVQLFLPLDKLLDSLISNCFKEWELIPLLNPKGREIIKSRIKEFNLSDHHFVEDKIKKLFIKQKLPNQMFYKVDRSSMYFGIESRPPLVENDILNYALIRSLKENDFKSKKAIKNHNIMISNNNEIVKKLMNQKKKGFGCPSSILKYPSKKEINAVAEYLCEFLNQDNFIRHKWNNKRQSQMIKSIYEFIS